MVPIFIWAARLPTVAVGLSAVLRFARAAPIPAATEPRGGVGIIHSVTSWCPTRNTQPVLPRHTPHQVLSYSQRAAVGHTAHSYPTLHVGLLKFAPSGSLSMISHRQQASNKEIPSIWRLTEWWCREYTPWGKMGGGGDCNKLGARAPAAHLPLFIVFHPLHHSVADDRRQRNSHRRLANSNVKKSGGASVKNDIT